MTNTKEKAKPRTSANYDLELATMANCKKLILRLSTDAARARVVRYLETATMGAHMEAPTNHQPTNPNQATLFEAE